MSEGVERPYCDGHWMRDDGEGSDAPAYWSIIVRYRPWVWRYSGFQGGAAVNGDVQDLPADRWHRAFPDLAPKPIEDQTPITAELTIERALTEGSEG